MPSWACTVVYPGIKVGPNFRVRVVDHGRPVEGLRVEIGSYVRDTDTNGFAFFRGVRPGSYHLSAHHDAGIPDGAELEVKPDGPTDVTVPLKWPNSAPILVRSLKGTIRGPDYLPGRPQPTLSLDVMEGISGKWLMSLQTDDNGEFNFDKVAAGLYFLNLKSGLTDWSGQPLTGLVAVAVDYAAPTDHLDIGLGSTSCGLWYADRSKCPQSDLQLQQLSGRVIDISGAAIGGAKILLFDLAGKLVEQLQSDRTGNFVSPHSLAGTYELAVSSPGFTVFRRMVHMEPRESTSDLTRHSPLTVQLGIFGSCSATQPQ